eukprot:TRINITY_DN18752_c0_g1_i1.p1 TRINITY_DN18752_c0_g1~~TRINITY_DN18752_c0_g1_i1.p1  ORF type:complete len:184 (+),score=27.32 TRINITY_DN18752_c0_g1_i1:55-606(+)
MCIRDRLVAGPKYGHIIGGQKTKTLLSYWRPGQPKTFLRCSVSERLTCMQLSHNENFFFAGSISGLLYVWDTITGELLKRFQAHHKPISKILVSNDDGMIVTVSHDFTLCVWLLCDIVTQNVQYRIDTRGASSDFTQNVTPYQTLRGHLDKVVDASISIRSGGLLASLSSCLLYTSPSPRDQA